MEKVPRLVRKLSGQSRLPSQCRGRGEETPGTSGRVGVFFLVLSRHGHPVARPPEPSQCGRRLLLWASAGDAAAGLHAVRPGHLVRGGRLPWAVRHAPAMVLLRHGECLRPSRLRFAWTPCEPLPCGTYMGWERKPCPASRCPRRGFTAGDRRLTFMASAAPSRLLAQEAYFTGFSTHKTMQV